MDFIEFSEPIKYVITRGKMKYGNEKHICIDENLEEIHAVNKTDLISFRCEQKAHKTTEIPHGDQT